MVAAAAVVAVTGVAEVVAEVVAEGVAEGVAGPSGKSSSWLCRCREWCVGWSCSAVCARGGHSTNRLVPG